MLDLLDKERNLFNGKKSDVLALFDIKGKPFEKVSYHGSPQQVLRDCSIDKFLNSITISVKDENGELYGSANDPRTANDPGPQMIPKLNRK